MDTDTSQPAAPKRRRWFQFRLRTLFVLAMLFSLVALPVGYYIFILDWQDKPFCHKQIMLGFTGWIAGNGMNPNTLNNPFPNVGGDGRDSLAAIHKEMCEQMEWAHGYGYIPGLRQDDPGDLVLMYFNRPTRWTMHVMPPTIFTPKEWILIPVDFTYFGSRTPSGPGEASEPVSANEFKKRLKKTIDFIRENKRPHWQAIVAEQTKFLDSIDDSGR
jgi:hypothetical protein